jgi:SpoVK/Ycf46/Vps4 family AAA+-type ATPase
VPFEDFRSWVGRQAVERVRVSEADLRVVLEGMVVEDPMLDLLGPAINSGRSLFLHGGPGNGKTLLAERVAQLFGQRYYVPHAVLVDGSIMIVHDPVHHRTALDERETGEGAGAASGAELNDPEVGPRSADILRMPPAHDRRFAEARRPIVVTGGELTLDQLDLQWDASGRMYQAPPQLKAAGGVLVVDDLGRQRVPVPDLLNRWVVPLEQRRDYLTLRSGRKIVVPFDCFVIFSTNLAPRDLADEAFLRRIHYKIEVAGPARAEYERIFRGCCEERGIEFDADAVEWLYREVYADGSIEPRRCHPRDVLDHVADLAGYRGAESTPSVELLEAACRSYFLSTG